MSKLTITLKSDLCVGSGEGFSGLIDTDVCSDKTGLPYIPARRLKGALLDAAKYIGSEKIDKIFGVSGSTKSGSLRLGNAVLNSNGALVGDINRANDVLGLFSSIKSQTAIENDSAKPNSLRFTRVVNQYSPFDGRGELSFTAAFDIDKTLEADFENICLAVRNIGLNRTRGLGAVQLQVKFVEKACANDNNIDSCDCLPFGIRLEEPLMLPSVSNTVTEKYISGTAIMGALASAYLLQHSDTDRTFEEIFLMGKVNFSNAYINGAVPAPQFVMKEKQSGVIAVFPTISDGQTWKSMKDKYVHFNGNDINEAEVQTETVYHHRRDEDAMLYTQERLCMGQSFYGEIIGDSKYLDILRPLLKQGLRLGRSKSAEYSSCEVIFENKREPAPVVLENGADYVLALESDLLFFDDNGNYSANDADFIECIKNKLSLNINQEHDQRVIAPVRIVGFYGKWNLKKPHIIGIKAGSYVCFTHSGSSKNMPQIQYIGEKTGEGFGRVRIYEKNDIKGSEAYVADTPQCSTVIKELLEKKDSLENVRNFACDFAEKHKNKLKALNAAFVGRVSLMISQSQTKDDFLNRVDSIMSREKHEAIQKIITAAVPLDNDEYWKEKLSIVFTLAKYWLKEVR